MAFPEPETALASTIYLGRRTASGVKELRILEPCGGPSTIHQSLTRTLNDLQKNVSVLRYAQSNMESGFQCAACGEWNTTSVDESAGRRQNYVEDCQVCCKPNVLHVEYDNSSQEFFITAELE
jgi:hypothetical protein